MSDHLLRVELDRDTVCLSVQCVAAPDAPCHMVCANPDHEACSCVPDDLAQVDYCNPSEFINSTDYGNVAEMYDGDEKRITLNDGMPIEFRWDGLNELYVWELAPQPRTAA